MHKKALYLLIIFHILLIMAPIMTLFSYLFDSFGFAPYVLYIATAIVLLITRMICRVKRVHFLSYPSYWIFVPFFLLYLLGHFANIPYLETVSFWCTFLYAILLFPFRNLSRLDAYLDTADSIADMPVLQINRINTGAMAVLLCIVTVTMLLFHFLPIDNIFYAFLSLLALVLKFLLSLILSNDGSETVEEDLAKFFFSEASTEEEEETSPFWQMVFNILGVLLLTAIAAFLIFLLVRFLIRLVKSLAQPYDEEEDQREFLPDSDEKSFVLKDMIKQRLDYFRFNPETSIRRMYKKLIQKRIKKDAIQSSMSPDELETCASLEASDSRKKVHELYEKARYSGAELTKEDVEQMTASVKNMKK